MNIIVSGASKGIGREIAKQYAELGHNVLAIARNKANLESLSEYSDNIKVLAIDINDDTLKEKISSIYEAASLTIDVLINNAGQLINKPFRETSSQDFKDQFSSNVLSVVQLSQACIPYMNGGHIVNITSMGGFQGSSKFPGLSAYSASKGALSILTECMAEELKEYGISVNALALGAVQTEMLKAAFPDYEAPVSASDMAEYVAGFGLQGNRYYNGQILPVTLSNPN